MFLFIIDTWMLWLIQHRPYWSEMTFGRVPIIISSTTVHFWAFEPLPTDYSEILYMINFLWFDLALNSLILKKVCRISLMWKINIVNYSYYIRQVAEDNRGQRNRSTASLKGHSINTGSSNCMEQMYTSKFICQIVVWYCHAYSQWYQQSKTA